MPIWEYCLFMWLAFMCAPVARHLLPGRRRAPWVAAALWLGLWCIALGIATSADAQTSPHKPRDPMSVKAFVVYSAADVMLMSTDTALSAHYLSPRASICHEVDPLYGRKPSPGRFWITGAAILVGEQALSWQLRKRGKGWWPLPMIADSFLHAAGAMSGPHGACVR